jgi:hypothetical protein
MNLKQYFKDEPYGAKKEMADYRHPPKHGLES